MSAHCLVNTFETFQNPGIGCVNQDNITVFAHKFGDNGFRGRLYRFIRNGLHSYLEYPIPTELFNRSNRAASEMCCEKIRQIGLFLSGWRFLDEVGAGM